MRKLLLPITIIAVIAMTFGSLAIVENLTAKSYAKPLNTETYVCEYLAEQIAWYMIAAEKCINRVISTENSVKAANYLKLYELCECNKRDTKLLSKIIDKLIKEEMQ